MYSIETYITIATTGLFVASEALSFVKKVKANGIVQLITQSVLGFVKTHNYLQVPHDDNVQHESSLPTYVDYFEQLKNSQIVVHTNHQDKIIITIV